MNFRQGNESTTEIHELPNFRMVQLNSCRVYQNNKLVQLNWFHVYDFPHRCSLTIFRIHVDRSTEKRLWIHPTYMNLSFPLVLTGRGSPNGYYKIIRIAALQKKEESYQKYGKV